MFGFAISALAEHRSSDELIAIARAALIEHNIIGMPQHAPGKETDGMQILLDLEEVAVVGNPEGGFAVIAKDSNHETLWGYSSAPFDRANPAPGFLDMMASINECMAKGNGFSTRSAILRAVDTNNLPKCIDPLITTQWSQDSPYNGLTPIIDGEHCKTGCTATALAQIVNYYGRPNQFPGTEFAVKWFENGAPYERFEVDMSTLSWDFGQMVSNYYTQDYTEQQANSVANLMYACGLMNHEVYGLKASAGAISDHLRNINYKSKDRGTVQDIAEGNPIIYIAADHAMIMDGYDENGFMHINFGWGGRSDGFYAMNDSEFEYGYVSDDGSFPGYVIEYCDKVTCENSEYYFNPFSHKALLYKPLMKDSEHLQVTDVCIPSSIVVDDEEYEVVFSEKMKAYANTDVSSFTFEEGITSVPSSLAYDCNCVKEIHLPSTIQYISDFALCSKSIEHIYSAAIVPPALGSSALPVFPLPVTTPQKVTLHVPAETIAAYRQAPEWKRINKIVAIDNQAGIDEFDSDDAVFSFNDGLLTFTAGDASTPVRIFTAAGVQVRIFTLPPHSTESLSIDGLSAGIYIVEIDGKTQKVRVP